MAVMKTANTFREKSNLSSTFKSVFDAFRRRTNDLVKSKFFDRKSDLIKIFAEMTDSTPTFASLLTLVSVLNARRNFASIE